MSTPTTPDRTPLVESATPMMEPEGDDLQFDGYPNDVRVATKHVDTLSDEELRELNRILPWHCFTVDAKGRRFGRCNRPGEREDSQDILTRRLRILDDAFHLAGKHVLEAGCFEGIHTVGLCHLGAMVTAIDSRIENVVKTIVRCSLFDVHPTVFKCDLDVPADVASLPQVDLLHHTGVLDHVVDPVSHILNIAAKVREGMMLDTHVARSGEDTMTYFVRGKNYAYRDFRNGGQEQVFPGTLEHAKALSINTLLILLRDAGFPDTAICETREERDGLRVLVLARRESSSGRAQSARRTPDETRADRARDTISDEYLQLQSKLHENPSYGVASLKFGQIAKDLFLGIQGQSISDYGAGKCRLREALTTAGLADFAYYPYDPVFPEYGEPRPADLVCCLDVLEHVEEPYIDRVISDLKSVTVKCGLFSIATGPAKKMLADGRNAHLIQKPSSWWLPKFLPHFDILHLVTEEKGFWFVVRPAKT